MLTACSSQPANETLQLPVSPSSDSLQDRLQINIISEEDYYETTPKFSRTAYNITTLCGNKNGAGDLKSIAPEYVDDDYILFYDDLYTDTQQKGFLYQFNRDNQSCSLVYEGKGFGMVKANDAGIYWTDYDITNRTDMEWEIKGYDVKSQKVFTIATGYAENNNESPMIQAGTDFVSWIVNYSNPNLTGDTISELNVYRLNDGSLSTIADAHLDEQAERNGDYFIQQEVLGDREYMLLKSTYKDDNKTFALNYYKDDQDPILLSTSDELLSTVSNDKYLVYTDYVTNKLFAVVRTEPSGEPITFQVPMPVNPVFIDEDTVLVRSNTAALYVLDLQERVATTIDSEKNTIIGLPIHTNGLSTYVFKKMNASGETTSEFIVLE
jgi:hypothetical protein